MSTTNVADDLGRPQGFLPACLLLLVAEQEGYGYELVERLRPFSFDVGDPSHVYRALRSLEAQQLASSAWTSTPRSGPARRVYSITPAGRQAVQQSASKLGELRASVDEYLARFHALSAQGQV